MTLCSQRDKDEFFSEYKNDLNFHHVEAADIDEKTVRKDLHVYLNGQILCTHIFDFSSRFSGLKSTRFAPEQMYRHVSR